MVRRSGHPDLFREREQTVPEGVIKGVVIVNDGLRKTGRTLMTIAATDIEIVALAALGRSVRLS